MKKLCIYHHNCMDGFSAAWVVRKKFGDSVEFFPGVYQNPPPELNAYQGRDVILVDFSYAPEVIEEMAKQANSILILDHHQSAEKDFEKWLNRIIEKACIVNNSVGMTTSMRYFHYKNIKGFFTQDQSGCGMAWNYYFYSENMPKLLRHIQDRDLWKFDMLGTKNIQQHYHLSNMISIIGICL